MKKIPVIVIAGPTASGKTGLGIKIANAFGGEIISADSMQIYKGMDIASAKPDESERAQAVHHLIDFADPSEKFSVADYVALAAECAADIHSRGKIPVVVGGTGLYIDSFINNIVFEEDKSDPGIRQRLSEEYDEMGGDVLLKRLRNIDPESAAKLHFNDRRRIVRALEIYELTGEKKSVRDERSREYDSPYDPVFIGLKYDNRELLYERIDRRVDLMIERGLVDEARAEYNIDPDTSAAQAIGHKELKPYFSGEIALETAVENLKHETRRYAKRQMTWFKRNPRINWISCDNKTAQNIFSAAEEILVRNGF